MAGYSTTPLVKKLGIKENFRVRLVNAPSNFIDLLTPLPTSAKISTRLNHNIDLWHLFTKSKTSLVSELKRALSAINQDGMIWVSWPKKSAGVTSDMTEDEIRNACLPLGLVDIKVCAVDNVWSGLKLVIRKELRK